MGRWVCIACLLALPSVQSLSAGKYNQAIAIGDQAPIWKDLIGTDDKKHSLSDLENVPFVVVVFTCNSCPYAVDYEDRLIDFVKKHAADKDRIELIAINVNTIEEDKLPAMKTRAKEKGFNFAYLIDETQQIAKAYGATRTPEVFLLDRQRKVIYMGAMDDNSMIEKVKSRYLEDAISSAKGGTAAPSAETPPVGCAIRFNRPKRTKAKS